MRYIRTDNEVYDTEELWEDSRLNGKPYVTKLGWCIYKESIVASADSIEELCDEFVAISKDNKYRSLVKIEETGNRWVEDKITQWCEILKNKLVNWHIYGAIWTDKGLIYVARMNDKGELELL